MPLNKPSSEDSREESKGRPRGSRIVQSYSRAELGLDEEIHHEVGKKVKIAIREGKKPPVAPTSWDTKVPDSETTRLAPMDFERIATPQGREDFKAIDKVIDELLELVKSEPIAIFGSHALFRMSKSTNRLPADTDIATTPKGAYELFHALVDRIDVTITEEPAIHNPNGPLKSIRFAGNISLDLGERKIHHPFEVFGEGGELEGEKFLGLFRMGDQGVEARSIITNKLIRAQVLLEAYGRLVKEIEEHHPSDRYSAEKWRGRRQKIEDMKREIQRTGRFDRKEFLSWLENDDEEEPTLSVSPDAK